ncbi:hypothetical protein [Citrobacter europaeus]|uniref:hypothetical protein n=1 Tax=Citrobacter europaeus TaxID=1914243 RepID=UPI0011312422|nr:hypothetical protein [Citrobacter europaeus]
MNCQPTKKSIDILCLVIIILTMATLIIIVIVKDSKNLPIPKELLLLPPIIASLGIIRFYKSQEKLIEILFGISGSLAALSMCIDSISFLPNDLFAYFMQNKVGYLSLSIIAALLVAKTIISIADYIAPSSPPRP